MFNILRRGPASATTSLLATTFCSQCARTVRLRGGPQLKLAPRIYLPLAARLSGTSPQLRKPFAAGAAYSEVEQDDFAEEPLAEAQTGQAAKQAPVTKFKDLAERGLVCQTVVDTLTRDMGLETMTQVQSLTLNESLKGTDV
jgi:ATP-dependent RNA helicase MSS116